MVIGLWAVSGVMAAAILILAVKVYLLKKSLREIRDGFADRLMTGTNTLISVSSRDRRVRELAREINVQLAQLRGQRHRYLQGDAELKNAVANISHDLRTPLTAICGYLDLLEKEETPETVKRYLSVIRERTEAMTQLTEELFAYSVLVSKGDSGERTPVCVGDVLEECIAACYAQFGQQKIVPAISLPSRKVIRNLDRSALARIFSNLLNNALKYSNGDLEICLRESGEIEFSNTAPGLDGIQVGKLFDRFYTVETAGHSTGLGLSIAKTLTERMRGEISASYENNRLTIRVVFPEF